MDTIPSAVLPDPRPQELKEIDYTHEVHYGGLPVVWQEKTDYKLPSQRFQNGSYTCVMQGSASSIEVLLGKIFSAAPYQLREGGGQGMYLQNAGDILYKIGTEFEINIPSQNMNDAQIDALRLPEIMKVKVTGYRTFSDYKNIDAIAEAIQAYGQCNITFGSNHEEWKITPQYLGTPITFYHNICAIDYCLRNGVKTLVCRDSAGQDSSPAGIRFITQDFLSQRGTGAIYYLGAKFIEPEPLFTRQMEYGSTGLDVFSLQTLLIKEGCANFIPTGFFGNKTGQGVINLQVKYGISPVAPRVGPKTLLLINRLSTQH